MNCILVWSRRWRGGDATLERAAAVSRRHRSTQVAPETVLYDVYAAASPDAVSGKDARVERIGRVVATSVAIPSPAGSPIV